jgi:hypothetical protein
MDAQTLAELLVERLRPYVPRSIHLEAASGMVLAEGKDYNKVATGLEEVVRSETGDRKYLAFAALSVLADVQEVVHQEFGTPWPAESGQELPTPQARATEDRLKLWYGEEAHPDLELEPIPVSSSVQ